MEDPSNSKDVPLDKSTARIWDRFAEGYSKQPIKDEASYQKKLKITQSYFKPTDQVVEIGCGTGGTALLHSPWVKKILATDISDKMLEIARHKAEESGVTNVEFRQASVDSLALPPASQDVVLGMSILHLLPNRDQAMKKVHGWLKPGGLFVTSTICPGDMGSATTFLLNYILPIGHFLGFVPKVSTLTREDLKESFRKSGFDIEYEWQPSQEAAVFIVGRKK